MTFKHCRMYDLLFPDKLQIQFPQDGGTIALSLLSYLTLANVYLETVSLLRINRGSVS